MSGRSYDFSTWTIQDPVHGTITFGEIERAIIDHSFFQRLHGLRQNALLYLIFPSANHTRFDHSVGVMHLADKFFSSIHNNQERICKAGRGRNTFQDDYSVDTQQVLDTFRTVSSDPYFRISLRAAGLFHDIGHGPLSHLFDEFFPTAEEMIRLTTPNDTYSHISKSLEKRDAKVPVRHEVLSTLIATKVLRDISSELNKLGIDPDGFIRDVCCIIDNSIEPSPMFIKLPFQIHLLLHDIIDNDIDADRMDFLLRDSHMCGVNYGLYDPDRILKSMSAYGLAKSKQLRVGIRSSGLGALEDFLFARYQMYSQIYGHKTNRACYAMLMRIKDRLDQVNWSLHSKCSTIDELLDRFKSFDDHSFISALQDKDTDYGAAKIKEITDKLFLERKLVKRVYEIRIPVKVNNDGSTDETEVKRAEDVFDEYQKKLERLSIEYIPDKFINKGPAINDRRFYLRVLKKDPVHGYYLVHDLGRLSTVAKYLPPKEYTFRVYCKQRYLVPAKEALAEILAGK